MGKSCGKQKLHDGDGGRAGSGCHHFDFLFFQVKHDDAETAGHISQISVEKHVVDGFGAHDVLVLDFTHVFDAAFPVDEINVGVGVGHKKLALALVVAHCADADIRQPVDFVDDIDGIVLRVVVEQFILSGGINLGTDGFHGNHFVIGQMRAPTTDGNAVLGKSQR